MNSSTSNSKGVQNESWISPPMLSMIAMGIGLIGVLVAFIAQFFTIKNGSSGQTNIAAKTENILLILGSFIAVLLVSGIVFISTKNSTMPYVWLFAFAMLSFVVSNIALLISTFQVSVERI